MDIDQLSAILANYTSTDDQLRHHAAAFLIEAADANPIALADFLCEIAANAQIPLVQSQAVSRLSWLIASQRLPPQTLQHVQSAFLEILNLPNCPLAASSMIIGVIADYVSAGASLDAWPGLVPTLTELLPTHFSLVLPALWEIDQANATLELHSTAHEVFESLRAPDDNAKAQMLVFDFLHLARAEGEIGPALASILPALSELPDNLLDDPLNAFETFFDRRHQQIPAQLLAQIIDFLLSVAQSENCYEHARVQCLYLFMTMAAASRICRQILISSFQHVLAVFGVCLSNPTAFPLIADEAHSFAEISPILGRNWTTLSRIIESATMPNDYARCYFLRFIPPPLSLQTALGYATSNDQFLRKDAIQAITEIIHRNCRDPSYSEAFRDIAGLILAGLDTQIATEYLQPLEAAVRCSIFPNEILQQFVSPIHRIARESRNIAAMSILASLFSQFSDVDAARTFTNHLLQLILQTRDGDFLIPLSTCLSLLHEEERQQIVAQFDIENEPWIQFPGFTMCIETLDSVAQILPAIITAMIRLTEREFAVAVRSSRVANPTQVQYLAANSCYITTDPNQRMVWAACAQLARSILERFWENSVQYLPYFVRIAANVARMRFASDLAHIGLTMLAVLTEIYIEVPRIDLALLEIVMNQIVQPIDELGNMELLVNATRRILSRSKSITPDIFNKCFENVMNVIGTVVNYVVTNAETDRYSDTWDEQTGEMLADAMVAFLRETLNKDRGLTLPIFHDKLAQVPYFVGNSDQVVLRALSLRLWAFVCADCPEFQTPPNFLGDLICVMRTNDDPIQSTAIECLWPILRRREWSDEIDEILSILLGLTQVGDGDEAGDKAVEVFGKALKRFFADLSGRDILERYMEVARSAIERGNCRNCHKILLELAMKFVGQGESSRAEQIVSFLQENVSDEFELRELGLRAAKREIPSFQQLFPLEVESVDL